MCAAWQCVAAFFPDIVSVPVQGAHISLRWNGSRVAEYFDFGTRLRQPL